MSDSDEPPKRWSFEGPLSSAPNETRESVLRHIESRRATIADAISSGTIPSHTEGIDLKAIKAFFARHDLVPATAVIILHPDEIPEILENFSDFDFGEFLSAYLNPNLKNKPKGQYFPESNTIFIVRERDTAVDNDLIGTIVHEKAHSVFKQMIFWGISPEGETHYTIRPSQSMLFDLNDFPEQGSFLREGICELLAAEFIREVLGKPFGDWNAGDRAHFVLQGFSIPAIYISKGSAVVPALAVDCIKSMSNVMPGLIPALMEATRNSDRWDDVAEMINSIQSGLYQKLHKLTYSEKDFISGLFMVRRAIDAYRQLVRKAAAAKLRRGPKKTKR